MLHNIYHKYFKYLHIDHRIRPAIANTASRPMEANSRPSLETVWPILDLIGPEPLHRRPPLCFLSIRSFHALPFPCHLITISLSLFPYNRELWYTSVTLCVTESPIGDGNGIITFIHYTVTFVPFHSFSFTFVIPLNRDGKRVLGHPASWIHSVIFCSIPSRNGSRSVDTIVEHEYYYREEDENWTSDILKILNKSA